MAGQERSEPVSSQTGGSAVDEVEQLVEALSKENFKGLRTTEFYVVILTWLLPVATLIWHRDFSSLAVPLSTLAAGIANAAYAISRAMTKSGRARAIAAITANPAGAIASGASTAESLAADIQALRSALEKLPADSPAPLAAAGGAGDAASVPARSAAIETTATTPAAAPDPFAAWPGSMQPGAATPGDPGSLAPTDQTNGGSVSEPQPLITRPPTEIYGFQPADGMAGCGVNTAIGNFTLAASDLTFPSGLLGLLDWTRTYNSLSGAPGYLGNGWVTAFSASLAITGTGGQAESVALRDEAGRVLTFTRQPDGTYTRPADLAADLTQNADGSFALAFFYGENWSFDAAGQLIGRSREGQTVGLTYNSAGRLASAMHSSGTQLSFSYTPSGQLGTVASSDGRTANYGYAADGALTSVTVPGGGVTAFAAAPSGQIGQMTDPDGNLVVANSYDGSGRVSRQDYALGAAADFAYDTATGTTTVTVTPGSTSTTYLHSAAGYAVQITSAAGDLATLSYDTAGQLTAATSPGGTQLEQTWDATGNLLASTWGGATSAWTYDETHRLASATMPTGGVSTFGYTGESYLPSKVTNPNGAVTLFTVENGLVTSQTDPDGNTTTFGYNAAGQRTSTTTPGGETTQFGYDAVGHQTSITAPSGAAIAFSYDGAGLLTSVTDPIGGVTAYQYSAAGLLQSVTDPAGGITRFAYDAAGNQTGITDPLARTTSFGFNPLGYLTSLTNLAGGVTQSSYDVLGRLVQVIDPVGAEFSYSYDGNGNQITATTPAGTTHSEYDARGNQTSFTDATGSTVLYGYDLNDQLNSVTDQDGGIWSISYDLAGNAITRTDPLGAVSTQSWTPAGMLAQITDPLGRTKTVGYDSNGRIVSVTNAEGGVTSYEYGPDGERISVTTPAGLTTRFQYDEANRLSACIDPRGWITRFGYDARGQQTEVIQPSGATRRHVYDAAGQLTEVIDANGSVTRYVYDSAGQISEIVNAKGAVTRLTHDANGRQTSSTDPLGRTTSREYDQTGRLIAITDPVGHVVRMTYDAEGRLTGREAEDAITVTFAYDAAGRRTSMTDATGTTRYAYDTAGRLTSVTEPQGAEFTYSYNPGGQRTAMTYPDGLQLSYTYDLNGRLTGLQDSRAGDAVYALDPDGRLLTAQLPGRLARRYHYEGGLLHRFQGIRDGRPISEVFFTRDPDGRILSQRADGVTSEYRYDPAGQLVFAANVRGQDRDEIEIAYDAVGNRVRMHRDDADTHYRYDEADQLVALDRHRRRTEFRYDSSGRMIEETDGQRRRAIGYDGFGLPVNVTSVGYDHRAAERVRATFDGSGLLASLVLTSQDEQNESERSATVRYSWSQGRIPQVLAQRVAPRTDNAELNRPGRLDSSFAYGYGRTFASWGGGGAAFHKDAFGSTVRTPDTADWAQARRYSAFGEPEDEDRANTERGRERSQRSPEVPRFGYRGELALGDVVYLRARAYDTRLGRFLSRDPLIVTSGPSHAANPYVYARNDPLHYVDPLGKLAIGSTGEIFTGVEDVLKLAGRPFVPGCQNCQHTGNAITVQCKCFQFKACLRTRGWFDSAPSALWGDPIALNFLWNRRLRERAAQGFTIAQLNYNREGFWASLGHLFGGDPVQVSPYVDWETRLPAEGENKAQRFDILTSQTNLFEVKWWWSAETEGEVQGQINRYIRIAAAPPFNLRIKPSTELSGWANAFYVINGRSGLFDVLIDVALVYVWGFANPPGHIYFAYAQQTNDNVKAKVYYNHQLNQIPLPFSPGQEFEPAEVQELGGGEVIEFPILSGGEGDEPFEPAA
jgi:RHS repeat-associated protein